MVAPIHGLVLCSDSALGPLTAGIQTFLNYVSVQIPFIPIHSRGTGFEGFSRKGLTPKLV